MIKLVCFFRRKPGLSREDFHRHWRDAHGPLIAGTPELARHIVRYEQNHRLPEDYAREDACDFDGATCQWLESMDSFSAFVREPKYRELIAPDEGRFIDRASITLLFTEDDDVKIDGGDARLAAPVKLLCLLKRKQGVHQEQFHAHWRGQHAALFVDSDALSRHVIAYHQSHRLEGDYARDGGGGYDGLAEQWYASLDEFQKMVAEPAYAEQIAPDENLFIDRSALTLALSAQPDVIIG